MVENKKIEKINKQLRKQIVQKFGVAAVALLAVGSVAYFGSQHSGSSHALTTVTPGFSISTAATSNAFAAGSTITAAVQENSSDPVNAVQASITYDAAKLQYVSMSEGTAFPTVAATSTATPGLIRVGRATLAGSAASGLNTVVNLQFKVLGTSGTTSLAFDPAFSFIVRSSDNVNIMSTNTGATYSLKLPAPAIQGALSPASGSTGGGTVVTISGANFVSGATVKFGSMAATNVVYNSSSSLTATSPAASAGGAVAVTVTNPDGQTATSSASAFTYILPAPTLSIVNPSTGPASGGTTIKLQGTNFTSGMNVTIGGVAATNIVFFDANDMTVTTPAHAAGAADVIVSGANGTAVKQAGFSYVALAPTISGVSPAAGSSNGGAIITISGTNFVSGASVTFVTAGATGTPAAAVSFVSATSLKVTTPVHAVGTTSITVTNPDGQKVTLNPAYNFVLAGDANNDGRVNAIDLSILISHDGQNYPAADFNGDGVVGAADLAIMLGKWTW